MQTPAFSRSKHSRRPGMARRALALALAATAASLAASAAGAAEVTPYFQGYSPGSMVDALRTAGLTHTTLAFAVTRGTCAFDPYILDRMPDARAYRAAGGNLIISMGGADGVYAEIACNDDQLFALVEKLMLDSGTRRIDWDVEGHQLSNADATARRNRVLLRLKARYPDLYTSFTLPAWLNGLQPDGQAMMRATVAAGVKVDRVNVMVMTFGAENLRTMVSPSTLSQAVINAAQATANQLASLYPSRSRAEIHAMMGLTPMIGVNDDNTVFTLADARIVADYVKNNGIGLLAYWSFQRDRAQATTGMGSINDYSGVVQTNAQFLQVFKTAEGPVGTPAPAPAPTPVPAPPPVIAPVPAPVTCADWTAAKWYTAGETVLRLGKGYRATAGNQNSPPEWTPTHWTAASCANATTAPTATPVAPAPACVSTAWVMGKYYNAGAVVLYNGRLYRAKYANPGYNPTISTYYWAAATC